MKKKTILVLLFITNMLYVANAQISQGGKPLSSGAVMKKSVQLFEVPSFDYKKMLVEDMQAKKGKAFRYGKEHKVNLNPENAGTWQVVGNNKIWRLRIRSKDAYSISLVFNNFRLKNDARIFLYPPNKKSIIGAFDRNNNKKSGWFSTVPIAGEELILELNVPSNMDYGKLEISGIIHDYKNILKAGFGSSGYCNVNVNCPEGDDWQDEKRAVVKYTFSGYLCTGALLNNTAQDFKPYLLTAEHCLTTNTEAAKATFWFNYESETCDPPSAVPLYDAISSADVVATGGNLDFTLLELSQTPPESYNTYYAGWNRKSTPATSSVCIHHPDGDIKKISIDNDASEVDNYGSGYVYNSHWRILRWDVGTTEVGSSGSPLFDQDHLVVGDLTGGKAYCGNSIDDYYARFDMSWDYHSEAEKSLKPWLDPINTGAETLQGLDPKAASEGVDAAMLSINLPQEKFCSENQIAPQFVLQNRGTLPLTTATIGYQINSEEVVSLEWTGYLETNETETIAFGLDGFPAGELEIKASVSNPNGMTDKNKTNDEVTKLVFGQETIDEVLIEGDMVTCLPNLNSVYTAETDGEYLWSVLGGEIIGDNSLQSVEVEWDDWGERNLDLKVTNLCSSLDAETKEIKVLEQGINVIFDVGANGASVCWRVNDCDGNTIFSDCGLPSGETFGTTVCVPRGCYDFIIESETGGVESYVLNRASDEKEIISGNEVVGSETIHFILNAEGGLASFNLYPNPASSEIAVEASFSELYENATFAIYRLDGSRLTPHHLLDGRKVIDISTLPSGFYILKIKTTFDEFSKKFLKP